MLAVNFGAVAAYQGLSQTNAVTSCTSIPGPCAALMKQYYSTDYWQLIQALLEGSVKDVSCLMSQLAPYAFQCLEDVGTQLVQMESYALKVRGYPSVIHG